MSLGVGGCECPMTEPGPTLAAVCGGGAFMLFMGLLEVFLRSQCDLHDPCNRPQYRRQMERAYDFIVVGGGSAGAVVAARLSEEAGWRVLLLEAGLDEPTGAQVPSMFLNYLGSSIDWGYRTQERAGGACVAQAGRCSWPRGKVLGGTSVLNGMMYMRGASQDYDAWAAAGLRDWDYASVLPYFLKSEDNQQIDLMDKGYHATGGPLTVGQFPYHPPLSYAILQAGQELGYEVRDVNGARHSGFAIAQTTHRNGSRLSTARAFLRPALRRPNLHLVLNATVTRVLINTTTRQAYGVEVRTAAGAGTERVYAEREVVVCAGAVASPHLLQRSGVGDAAVLRAAGVTPLHHLPAVGRNLHNHVAHFLTFYLNDNDTAPLNWATAMEYLLFRDGLMSGTGISEVTAFVHSGVGGAASAADAARDNPDVQLFFGGYLADCARTGMVGERLGNGSRAVQIIPTVLRPRSRGHLALVSPDPDTHPTIVANYLSHPDDVRTLIAGIRFAIRLSETAALQRYGMRVDRTPVAGCERHAWGCDAYWECAVRVQTAPENHQAGSCRMGARDDAGAAVDARLQVRGVGRLRVADASVLPAAPSGNTNAPVIMVAERAADFIKQRWLGTPLLPPLRLPLPEAGGESALSNSLQQEGAAALPPWP